MIHTSLIRALSIALCAAALCAAPPRAAAQTRPETNAPPPPARPRTPDAVVKTQPAPSGKVVVAGARVPAGWQRYEFGEPRLFAVALPGKYEVEAEAVRMGRGLHAFSYTYSGETDEGTYIAFYMAKLPVDAARMPEQYKNEFYDGVWKGLVGGVQKGMENKGLLLKLESGESRPTRVGGLDGREQDFLLGPLNGRVRMVLSGSSIFLVILMESTEEVTPAGRAFLDSLEVYAPPR